MKTKRDVGQFLDFSNGSFMVSRATFDPTGGWKEEPDKENTPELTIKISDCGRTIINIHDFGETEEQGVEKIDRMIAILNESKQNLQQAWKDYNSYWAKKERKYF